MGDFVVFLLDMVFAAVVTVVLTWIASTLGRMASQDDADGGGGGGGWRRRPAPPTPRRGPDRSPQPSARRRPHQPSAPRPAQVLRRP